MERIFSLLIIITYLSFSEAWYENCNNSYNVTADRSVMVVSPNYPYRYNSGSSCKYYLKAPTGYRINLVCTYNLDVIVGSCNSQTFFVQREGDPSLSNSQFFCGYSKFSLFSVGVEMSFGYTSYTGGAGWFYCEAKPVRTTQENCECGWNKATKIVGGVNASPNEYVSMAALVDVTSATIFCGGSIISENYILTTASCFDASWLEQNIKVLVGDHDISTGTDAPYSSLYAVQQVIKHENYISSTKKNDIALVKTVEAIRWKKTIGPVCLPFSNTRNNLVGSSLIVLGWGTTSFGGASSTILRKVSLQVIDKLSCLKVFPEVTDSNICTYSKGKDACQYDSGGALYLTSNSSQYAMGIVSYGTGCAGASPGVHTRVSSYLSWIQTKAGMNAFFCLK